MKHITFFALISILALTMTACGAQPVPTVNAADVQHTAEAAAFTMVAQTQEAMPTSTPVPPTDLPTNTPAATDTPAISPTIATLAAGSTTVPTIAPASSANGTVDPCSTRTLSWSPRGKSTIIRIANLTKTSVNVSVYLNETAGSGECGYRAYTLTKLGDVVITDLVQGCYNLWAWSPDNKIHVNASGFGCINNTDKWTFEISADSIKFTQ